MLNFRKSQHFFGVVAFVSQSALCFIFLMIQAKKSSVVESCMLTTLRLAQSMEVGPLSRNRTEE